MADDLAYENSSIDRDLDDDLDPEALARNHAGWMLSLAKRLVREPALAEDVVQDALIRAINGLDTFEGRASVKTWLHRITANEASSRTTQRALLDARRLQDDASFAVMRYSHVVKRLSSRHPPRLA